MREIPIERRCREEASLLGFSLSAHPLSLLKDVPADIVPARSMKEHAGRRARMIGWAIAAKLVRTRKDGRSMKFLSCEDLTGTFEAVLFPDAYEQFASQTLGPGPYLLDGKIVLDRGAAALNVEKLEVLKIPGFETDSHP